MSGPLLYMMASGPSQTNGTEQTNAAPWAQKIGRQEMTVQCWVRTYNEAGMAAIIYQHTGGRSPLFAQQSVKR